MIHVPIEILRNWATATRNVCYGSFEYIMIRDFSLLATEPMKKSRLSTDSLRFRGGGCKYIATRCGRQNSSKMMSED